MGFGASKSSGGSVGEHFGPNLPTSRSEEPLAVVEYKLAKAGTGPRKFLDQKIPGDENQWAAVAYQASLRAAERARTAADFAAKAETHELIGRAASSQAQAAQLQVQFVSRANVEQNPRIKELQEYCHKAKGYLEDNPAMARGQDMMRIRRFCSSIDESLDSATRIDPDPSIDLGYDLYSQPAKEYPVPPPMPDGSGFDPRVHNASIPEYCLAVPGDLLHCSMRSRHSQAPRPPRGSSFL
mmetsp:Transcript_84709/g.132349  ORF Transcript_84709/g.132349 Transcript_84709/m.132349 type:complete len:240 (-) Transcript_84709:82-801(-)